MILRSKADTSIDISVHLKTSFLLLIFSPDESEKPFEIQLQIFPEYKERLKEAPLYDRKKQLDEKA